MSDQPTPPDSPRLRHRQERFCRYFVEYGNATVAAKAAGYSPPSARNAGYRLMQQPRINERIIEIQRGMAEGRGRGVDLLVGKLETVYRRAIDDHHFSAAARAIELQAKLSGASPATARPAASRRVKSSAAGEKGEGPEPMSGPCEASED